MIDVVQSLKLTDICLKMRLGKEVITYHDTNCQMSLA